VRLACALEPESCAVNGRASDARQPRDIYPQLSLKSYLNGTLRGTFRARNRNEKFSIFSNDLQWKLSMIFIPK
jgi:hypothetical protein